jgi:hypothetical protein
LNGGIEMRLLIAASALSVLTACAQPNYRGTTFIPGNSTTSLQEFKPSIRKIDDQFRPNIVFEAQPKFVLGNPSQAIFLGNSSAETTIQGIKPRAGGQTRIVAGSIISQSMGGWGRFQEARDDRAKLLPLRRTGSDVTCSGRASGHCTYIEVVEVDLPIEDLRRVVNEGEPGYRYKLFGGYEQPVAIPAIYIKSLFSEMGIPLTVEPAKPAPPAAPARHRR